MGFRQAVVLASVSFFLGVLFICFNVDYRVLYNYSEAAAEDGFQFYATFFNSPPAIKALLHGMMGAGLVGLLAKLFVWTESAMWFDGSCVVVYMLAIVVYMTVTIPSMRTIVDPVDVDTRADRIEALRILAAGNTIMMGLLGAVICLQAGQEYTNRLMAKELAAIEKEERDKKAAEAEKKDQ
ncbi:hypothetical protein PUNSTDRAFT_54452 [Punctularia strigosozonata HHB-11173 SS5]|uniref:uncharacterized protein n=1 Tax=Punctularia strigosozonata (strain HHB-11173) TaxID=741275 RepID=UPI00044166D5|nr:uncharacterized protein PUNSTDRAFT_54452 [Punctularia strigosozonata HHB-11173 SS5]EIN06174.1 hypothetical protein PUNSTDRAFT_54452 [Punctularia strigosozonata HHB-11173 SS5]